MESGSFLVFIAAMGLLWPGAIVFAVYFLKSIFRRDFEKIRGLCKIGGVCLATHLVWLYIMPSGNLSPNQFSGFAALMHYIYFIVLCWALNAMYKLSRRQPTEALQKDAPKPRATCWTASGCNN